MKRIKGLPTDCPQIKNYNGRDSIAGLNIQDGRALHGWGHASGVEMFDETLRDQGDVFRR